MRKISKIEPTVPKLKLKKSVAAYARVSRESERMEHSISAQISYYSNLIQSNPEWEYAGVYADYGISGTGISKRSEFKRLIEDCEKGKIQIVLVKSISRFARNTVDLLNTVRHLKDLGIEVRFERENINSMSSDGELLLSILAGFAEEESKSTSNNVKWALRKRFQKGKPMPAAAFGYRWNGETFVIDEDEAKAIRVIFENFLNDVPFAKTGRWLKENGYSCNSDSLAQEALKNEIYVGDLRLQKTFCPDGMVKKVVKNIGQLPQYYVKDNHQPIIDRETFDKVQAKIKESYSFNTSVHRIFKPSCFSAKIHCGKCGNTFTKTKARANATDKFNESWVCSGKIKYKAKFCASKNIVGTRLRVACCEVLEIAEFDKNVFSKKIEKIVTTDDVLEFYFYDGTVKTAKIDYYDRSKNHHGRVLGYYWSKGKYRIHEEEAKTIRLIYEYYAEGLSISEIVRKLTECGHKSVRGKLSNTYVTKILESDMYCGEKNEPIIDYELNKKVKEKRKCKNEKRNSNTCNN